jgi:hypothetical protein
MSGGALFFLFEKMIVFGDELFDLLRHSQELRPLLFVKRDGKASQAVYGYGAFLAYFERQLATRGRLQRLVFGFQPLQLRFHFFFCHSLNL